MGEINDEMAKIMLDNIIRVMANETFSKDKSIRIIGSEKKFNQLIEDGKIDSVKPVNKQNGKWYCNAAQVLLYCQCSRKYKRKKKKR